MSTLEYAIAIAAEVHADRVDQAGEPYILHPLRVMAAMRTYPGRIVGVLHDVIEDGRGTWSAEALDRQGFAPDIVGAVDALSKPRGVAYEVYIACLVCNGSPLARAVKIADLQDNLRSSRLNHLPIDLSERLGRKYRPALQRLICTVDKREF